MIELTQSRLQELLNYNPETGDFIWIMRTNGRIKVGGIAGCLNGQGYRVIMIGGRSYQAHRLAWLYMVGDWPNAQLDHINGVRDDNRWSKLREATHAENQQNRATNRNNTSGFMGVSWDRHRQKWRADIRVSGRKKRLGLFPTPFSAHSAYLAAKAEHHQFQPIPRQQ